MKGLCRCVLWSLVWLSSVAPRLPAAVSICYALASCGSPAWLQPAAIAHVNQQLQACMCCWCQTVSVWLQVLDLRCAWGLGFCSLAPTTGSEGFVLAVDPGSFPSALTTGFVFWVSCCSRPFPFGNKHLTCLLYVLQVQGFPVWGEVLYLQRPSAVWGYPCLSC